MIKKLIKKADESFLITFFTIIVWIPILFLIGLPIFEYFDALIPRIDLLLLDILKYCLLIIVMMGGSVVLALYITFITTNVIKKIAYRIPMKKYIQSVKSYIDNANLIQKAFLFIGVVAFFVWITSVKWSRVDNYLGYIWGGGYGYNHFPVVYSLWAMFIAIIGSYIFKDNPK